MRNCIGTIFQTILWLSVLLHGGWNGFAAPNKPENPEITTASTPQKVRIGLFTLFHLQTIGLKPAGTEILVGNGAETRRFESTAALTVTLRNGQLACMQGKDQEAVPVLSGDRLTVDFPHSDLSPRALPAIDLEVSGRKTHLIRRVSGELVFSVVENEIQTVLTEDTEAAVAIITASEMRGVKLPEALKAQAVVVRSFLQTHRNRHEATGFDLCDSTHCQLFFGEPPAEEFQTTKQFQLVQEAARATAGKILWQDAAPLEAYFTACCGGRTTTPETAWGTGKESLESLGRLGNQKSTTVCSWCTKAHFYQWQRAAKRDGLMDALKSLWGTKPSDAVKLQVAKRTPQGFVTELELTDGKRRVTFSNIKFRTLVGHSLGWNTVLSNTYGVEARGETYLFRGKGFGHQVGLCVEGTIAQAQAGRGYEAILRMYFPTAELR
ncbi:MAG: SpoIID/LytB domain-containing protein [Blastocatellia bacterium]|nr:SpoIID/LytB domain-containing protein [Blastocatellia bacterium]